MNDFLQALQNFFVSFASGAGLTIVRTLALFVVGLVLIKLAQSITRSVTLKSSKLDNSAASFIISIVTVALYVVLAIVLISSLGISTTGIVAAFSAVTLAIGLALKDSIGSLANGVIIIFTKPFKKGDYVQIGDYDGLVQDIRLFNTKILTYSNEEVIIPNSDILSSEMINYSTMPLRRIVIDVPIPYDADVAKAKSIILNSLTSYEHAVTQPAPAVVLKSYGDSALIFSARVWAPNEFYWDTLNDLYEVILGDLHEQGIDAVVARMQLAFKTPLRSGDRFVSRLGLRKEGIKYVFVQDIFRLPDERPVLRSTVETVCLVDGRLAACKELDEAFAQYL